MFLLSARGLQSRHVALALLVSSHVVGTVRAQSTTQVTLGNTVVTGRSQTFGGVAVDFFGAIPFAEPPVGALRFAPPVLMDNISTSTLDATQFGPACPQMNSSVIGPISEDCLTLNIFRPAGVAAGAGLPVAAWIYGGGFVSGQTSIYNATEIVVQSVVRGTPIVYVSIGYRVGVLGFPQGSEAEDRGVLNLGLKDQLTALQWVQNHIETFGGDPSKVTLFGESAGAVSIGDLYLNSNLEKLARGAIFESGAACSPALFNASRRQPVWDTFIANLTDCTGTVAAGTSIDCAKNASLDDVLTAWSHVESSFPTGVHIFHPVIDGPDGLIPDLPSRLFAQGKFAKLPFMAGTNLDEGTLFVPQALNTTAQVVEVIVLTDQPFATELSPAFQSDVLELLRLYPDDPAMGSPFGTGNETFGAGAQYKRGAAILGDLGMQAPRRAWMNAASAAGVSTFGFLFADENSALKNPTLGVTHTRELTYVYGFEAVESANPATVRLLSTAMVDYWLSFIVSQTPNDGKGLSKTIWLQYTSDEQLDTTAFTTASFANFTIIPDTYRAEQIAFINSVPEDFAV